MLSESEKAQAAVFAKTMADALLDDPRRVAKALLWALLPVVSLLLIIVLGLAITFRIFGIEVAGIRARPDPPKTFQAIVPASAGWVPLDKERPFEKGTLLAMSVAGRINIAIHHTVNFGNWDYRYWAGCTGLQVPGCQPAFDSYINTPSKWTSSWTSDPRGLSRSSWGPTAHCRIAPHANIGALVVALLAQPPSDDQLGPARLSSSSVLILQPRIGTNSILIEDKGYLMFAVNDMLIDGGDCDPLVFRGQENFAHFIDASKNSKAIRESYDIGQEFARTRYFDDNAGEFLVNLRLQN